METALVREWATDAIRFWEPRRILYNLVLTSVVVACFVVELPRSRTVVDVNSLLFLFLLAVLANVATARLTWSISLPKSPGFVNPGRNIAGFCSYSAWFLQASSPVSGPWHFLIPDIRVHFGTGRRAALARPSTPSLSSR